MITTVTLNASVDKLYLVESVSPQTVMRVKEVHNTAGGKGLNVARVAALAGERVRAVGFLGGFAGGYISAMLKDQGIETDFTQISGETRSCINIRDLSTGKHTEFLEPGAQITREDLNAFLKVYRRAVAESEVIAISGSVPQGTPLEFYGELVRMAREAGRLVLLDTSGGLLVRGVKAAPTLVKPNSDEIAQLLGAPAGSREELIAAAQRLHSEGIPIVAVSLGKDGVLVACAEGIFQGTTPDIPVVNTVGCGDSMVAGFAVGLARKWPVEETIRFASAVSTANALTMETGFFRQEDLDRLHNQIEVIKLN